MALRTGIGGGSGTATAVLSRTFCAASAAMDSTSSSSILSLNASVRLARMKVGKFPPALVGAFLHEGEQAQILGALEGKLDALLVRLELCH